MELLKITNAPDVTLYRKGHRLVGTVHLTTNHLIFTLTGPDGRLREMWISYPVIERIDRSLGSALLEVSNVSLGFNSPEGEESASGLPALYSGANIRLRCKDFTYYAFDFGSKKTCLDVYDTLCRVVERKGDRLFYAFLYNPGGQEAEVDGWTAFDVERDFERQTRVAEGWERKPNTVGEDDHSEKSASGERRFRVSAINEHYELCPTYPARLHVPVTITDSVLKHCAKFRSKARIPALSYLHHNNRVVTRCSQPLVGLKQSRSLQDERLVAAIFSNLPRNLIVDLRPLANAMAQTALGAGTENMDHYPNATRIFLNIDNIHVMRDSLARVVEVLKNSDVGPVSLADAPTTWLKHTAGLLAGVDRLAKSIHLNHMNMVIHCSDGWDRTAQVCSLLQICLDPHYRTMEGFMLLVEKEWCAFGHQFAERCNHDGSQLAASTGTTRASSFFSKVRAFTNTNFKSPTFHQFLDCVYQLLRQYPGRFGFNERFLRRLLYHVYSCQYGTFLTNCERQKVELRIMQQTRSVWDYFLSRRAEFELPIETHSADEVLYPNAKDVVWWWELFGGVKPPAPPPKLEKTHSPAPLGEEAEILTEPAPKAELSLPEDRAEEGETEEAEETGTAELTAPAMKPDALPAPPVELIKREKKEEEGKIGSAGFEPSTIEAADSETEVIKEAHKPAAVSPPSVVLSTPASTPASTPISDQPLSNPAASPPPIALDNPWTSTDSAIGLSTNASACAPNRSALTPATDHPLLEKS